MAYWKFAYTLRILIRSVNERRVLCLLLLAIGVWCILYFRFI